MSKIRISNEEGRWTVLLNGTDIAKDIVDGGLAVAIPKGNQPPVVTIKLLPTQLTLSLAEADVRLPKGGTR